jgi:hypothetical protein
VLLSRAGSFELIQYAGMENDLERMAALAERNAPEGRNSPDSRNFPDSRNGEARQAPARPLNSA